MLNEATREFIRQHADDDVRRLALQAHPADVDLLVALDQIQGRQTACRKLPSWAAIDGIVYPPHLSMEQCSSEQTAQYKAQLLTRLLKQVRVSSQQGGVGGGHSSLIDLTGGFGVDFAFMAKALSLLALHQPSLIYVERNPDLCALARHNFPLLGLPNAEVVCEDAETILHTLPRLSLLPPPSSIIYLDPARRNEHGGRTYGIADCTPNVLTLCGELLQKADLILLKLSPMLDWHRAVEELNAAGRQTGEGLNGVVREVHIVSVANECKELLLVLSAKSLADQRADTDGNPIDRLVGVRVYCVNDGEVFSYTASAAPTACPVFTGQIAEGSLLFVPNASIMKAGCFAELCKAYNLSAIAPNSHLFLNDFKAPKDFNDFKVSKVLKVFELVAVSSLNKRDVAKALHGIKQANIAVRNFPMNAEELRRRLKLKDGGDVYLFATTLADGKRVLLLTRKHPEM